MISNTYTSVDENSWSWTSLVVQNFTTEIARSAISIGFISNQCKKGINYPDLEPGPATNHCLSYCTIAVC